MIILVCLVMLVLPVSAASGPDQYSTIASSASWVVANGADHATITVVAQNVSTTFPNATVAFSVNTTDYGTISPASVLTDANGVATSVFTTKKKSGTAIIKAVITYGNVSVEKTISQDIDHDSPYNATFFYDNSVTVGTETPFVINFRDKWGNLIDNRKSDDLHTVSLHISSVSGAGAFDYGGSLVQDVTLPLDAQGNASVTVRVDTVAAENIIWQKSFGEVADHYPSITSVTDGVPCSMTVALTPDNPAALPADGAADHTFSFIYTLYDQYGNVASNQSLLLHTTWPSDTDLNLTSNSQGLVDFSYGPHESTGNISVTATSRTNSSVTLTKYIAYYSTEPVNMVVMASPESMASHDVDAAIYSNISAEVTDIMGNPVANETVWFTLGTPTYDGTYTINSTPYLGNASAVTDDNGFATVTFIPGGFTRNSSDPHYNNQATGHCAVTATWGSVSQSVQLTWKNYPYLSVETSVSPETIAVNDTVDVTIKLKGDGWALQPNPVDVILCTDRSGSMMEDNPDRMVSVMAAEKSFVGKLSFPLDHLGEVSFGQSGLAQAQTYSGMGPGIDSSTSDDKTYIAAHYPGNPSEGAGKHTYSSYATLDLPLSDSQSTIMSTIDTMIPYSGTPMRQGIYIAVNEMKTRSTRANAVKAIVILSDGDYNYYGDPLARGSSGSSDPTNYGDLTTSYRLYSGLGSGTTSSQNMSNYAKANGIRIYSIAYGSDISSSGQQTLKILAEGTGGKYYTASATDINDVYVQIAGDLRDEAGVNTTMSVKFETVNVTGVSVPGAEVYDYVYNPTASTQITWQDGNVNVTDQTDDWNADHNLDFNIGTIRLNETWQGIFRLKIKQEGNIEVFGNSSSLVFNNGTDSMTLPRRFVNVISNLTNPGITTQAIQISDLQITQTGVIKDLLPARWEIMYPGNKTASERIYYSNDNQQTWVQFDSRTGLLSGGGSKTEYASLDVRNLPAGTYYIRVVASAEDTSGDEKITPGGALVGTAGKSYIKLE
ncbi:MAG: VWA domain-containing protein [Methanoregula sp.]|nr:VWA domain-containing protein [Methanoregula sp.]